MMKGAIPISDARRIAEQRLCPIVVIFGIEESRERYTITTYGNTRPLCAWAVKIGEDIHQAVLRGDILNAEHAENPYEEIERLQARVEELERDMRKYADRKNWMEHLWLGRSPGYVIAESSLAEPNPKGDE